MCSVAMVDKDYILAEIRRTAAANGDAPLGWRRFAAETGVVERDRLDRLAFALADETRRLGRFPVNRELRIRHGEDPTFPDAKVFQNRWRRREQVEQVATYCAERPEYADVLAIVAPLLGAMPSPAKSERAAAPVVIGEVYLLRVGKHYKLGRSNAFGRRERELAIQLPKRATTVHVIKTDDPVGIEAYWHRRFADRRGNGERFALTAEDVAAFKRRKFM